jgi:HAE1 family hydrophobic/amphiphilic exporter-1
MNITEIFIRRPVMTTLVMLAILIFGVVGYRTLPVSDLPNVDFPTVQVNAGLPGASPEMMAASVATPLERQFSTIPGVDSMSSTSSLGSASITIQFALNRNLDAAAQDVQTAIATAQRMLPPGMPSPPTFRKVNPADMPILMISLNSPTLPFSEVDNYAENIIAQRISMVSGVAQVNVFGSMKYAVRAQLDPSLLASRGISINEVSAAISAQNVNMPSGTLWGPRQAYTVQATGQLTSAEAYRPLVVAYRNGAPAGTGPGDRQRAERQGGRMVQRQALRHPGSPAAAGHEHSGGRGLDQSVAAQLPFIPPPFRKHGHPDRPFGVDPRVGQ